MVKQLIISLSSLAKKRKINSLSSLTKTFIESSRKIKGEEINLNELTKIMKFFDKGKKRRIYDIIGVLEGIGLVKKEKFKTIKISPNLYKIYDDSRLIENKNQSIDQLNDKKEKKEQKKIFDYFKDNLKLNNKFIPKIKINLEDYNKINCSFDEKSESINDFDIFSVCFGFNLDKQI